MQRNRLSGTGAEIILQNSAVIFARLADLRTDGVEKRNNGWHKIKTGDQIKPWWESEFTPWLEQVKESMMLLSPVDSRIWETLDIADSRPFMEALDHPDLPPKLRQYIEIRTAP